MEITLKFGEGRPGRGAASTGPGSYRSDAAIVTSRIPISALEVIFRDFPEDTKLSNAFSPFNGVKGNRGSIAPKALWR